MVVYGGAEGFGLTRFSVVQGFRVQCVPCLGKGRAVTMALKVL